VATAPKSSASSRALEKTLHEVRLMPRHAVPLHLRQRTLRGAPEPGYGQGVRYPTQLASHFLFPQYLPDSLSGEVYFEPGDEGHEGRVRERLRQWWPDRPR
jgi:putative ATPase